MQRLVEDLLRSGVLKSPRLIEAFKHIDRADFLPEKVKKYATQDEPLPIGYGQTVSQPSTVAFMLELLDARENQKILDIGSGSGWQTALLAYLVSHDEYGTPLAPKRRREGKVYALEIVPEICRASMANISRYGFQNGLVNVHCRNARKGFHEHAPFDRIIAAAAGEAIPEVWKEELAPGGKLVAPLASGQIVLIEKGNDGTLRERAYSGFVFVPLV